MRKTWILAAVSMGGGVGYATHACDQEENYEYLCAAAAPHLEAGMEMVEIAEDIAMNMPASWADNIFDTFGDWYVNYYNDDGEHPNTDACTAKLAEEVIDAFKPIMNDSQQKRLKEALMKYL